MDMKRESVGAPTDPAPMTESEEFDAVRATIESTKLETDFRTTTAPHYARQLVLGMCSIAIPLIVFTGTDFLLFGFTAPYFVLLACRAAVVLGATYVIHLVRAGRDIATIDRVLLVWWLACAACVTTIDAFRPSTYLLHIAIDVLFVLTAYVVDTKWTTQLIAGAAMTIGPALVFATRKEPMEGPARLLIVIAFFYANTLGILLSRQLHASARGEFIAQLRARRARSTLRALSRLVPMCASCKSIKDGAGAWHLPEEYVHAETGQDITHGLCPTCVRKLYPELADRVLEAERPRQDG